MPDYDPSILTKGVSSAIDETARTYQNGKIADSIVRTNPEMLQALQMSKEQFGGLSAADRTSAISGAITAMTMKQKTDLARAQMQDLASQAQERQSIGQWRQAQASRDQQQDQAPQRVQEMMDAAQSPDGIGNLVSPMAPGMAPRMPGASFDPSLSGGGVSPGAGTRPTPAMMMQFMNRAGMAPDAQAKQIQNWQEMGLLPDSIGGMKFNEDPETGARFAVKGKSVLPSGVNPDKNQPTLLDLVDEDGNPTGIKGVVDHKTGKVQVVKTPQKDAGELQPLVDPLSKQPVPGFGVDATGKVHDFRSALQKAVGAAAAGSPAAAAPAAEATVRVRNKDGKVGSIPTENLKKALAQGYTLEK